MSTSKKISLHSITFAFWAYAFIALAACGSDSGSDAVNLLPVSEVETRFELGKCTEEQNGTTILVTTENAYYTCSNGMWNNQGDETINPENHDTPIQVISSSSYSVLVSISSTNTIESSSVENISSSKSSSSSARDVHSSSSSSKVKDAISSSRSSSSSVRDTRSSSSSSKMKKAWSYLNQNISYGEFTDRRDGQIYKTVKIGNQVWMAENLNYNIDPLKSICYNNDVDSCYKYGRLYSRSAVNDVCPQEWHLATIDEWKTLVSYVGSETAKTTLKSTSGWVESVGNGTNDFGFTALPAGWYNVYYDEFNSNRGEGVATQFWIAGEYEKRSSYTLGIDDDGIAFWLNSFKYNELWFYSIRCIEGPSPIIEISSSSSSDPKINNLNPDIDYGEFIDSRDGQFYKTVQIGNQVWMAENLNYEYGNNACYNDSSVYCSKYEKRYGRLYPYSTAKNICPKGWHLPDTSEWDTLFRYVKNSGVTYPGPLLRSKIGWSDTLGFYDYSLDFTFCNSSHDLRDHTYKVLNALGPDAFGFSWLPAGEYEVLSGGLYGDYPAFTMGKFKNAGSSGCFWSKSTQYDIVCIEEKSCKDWWYDTWAYDLSKWKSNKYEAHGVRCLKD